MAQHDMRQWRTKIVKEGASVMAKRESIVL